MLSKQENAHLGIQKKKKMTTQPQQFLPAAKGKKAEKLKGKTKNNLR